MDRNQLKILAETRLVDARAVLGRKRWSGAYYLSGYVVESALKACLLKYLGESNAFLGDKDYLKDLSGCWTHDLVKLEKLAGLEPAFGAARGANPTLNAFWGSTKDWSETSRYELKTEVEARELYEAVCNKPDGVFLWIRSRW